MARVGALAVLVFLLGCSSSAREARGYGMSIEVPSGWAGSVTHGLVRLRGDGLRIWIRETNTPETRRSPFFRRRTVPRLEAADFRSVENHHGFTISGRRFALLAFPAPATSDALEKLNRALRSFRVQPGDFYGDKVLPAARFPARPGWFAGARSGKLFAEGGQTETWASTTRYRDVPNQIPPHRTLSHLGRDGVILWVSLSRDSAIRARAYPDNSLHIDPQLIAANFEGLEPRFGLYRASVRRSQYEVGLWVFFGTLHPTTATVLRAQTQLDRLQLPRWPEG